MALKHMIRWRPWPPSLVSTKFHVHLHVLSFHSVRPDLLAPQDAAQDPTLMVEVKWKGSTHGLGCHFVRSHKVSRTRQKRIESGSDIVVWQEVFERISVLHSTIKGAGFLPFDVHFSIVQVGSMAKATIVGTSVFDIGEFAGLSPRFSPHTTKLQVLPPAGSSQSAATLMVAIGLSEVGQYVLHSSQCLSGPLICDQQIREFYGKKIREMKRSFSVNWRKASGELDPIVGKGENPPRSVLDVGDNILDEDLDALEISGDYDIHDELDQSVQNYSPLSTVNLVVDVGACEDNGKESTNGELLHQNVLEGGSDDDTLTSESDERMTMWSFLSWGRKRKLGFRSPPKRGKPLLNKAYGEDGGDDIDNDRRLSNHPVDMNIPLQQQQQQLTDDKVSLSVTMRGTVDFGDEHFSIGSWEKREIVSRDGCMKLFTDVFFASIDQRNERADGESACTTLVAVIADWLHRNPNRMPIKAEFDTLIREGSAEWRKLCDADEYRDKFPDRHFDLETVIKAKIRDVTVSHDHSFIGFFKLDEGDGTCNYLQSALTVDDIWEAINNVSMKNDGNFEPAIYIVSWNDHFFVFKVDKDAYYIIDTLGERLYEGCTQAYILRFDMETSLTHLPNLDKQGSQKCESGSPPSCNTNKTDVETTSSRAEPPSPQQLLNGTYSPTNQEELVFDQLDSGTAGKENSVQQEYCARDACKQFLKSFFASVPLRELEEDIKKGLLKEIPLQKLQIEFHYTAMR